MAAASAPRDGWIVGPGFDLAWVFGGAALSLAAVGLFLADLVPIVPLFWIWLIGFDGPHFGAMYARTYLDAREWKERKTLLLGSLVVFAVGPVCLAATVATGSSGPFLLFLGGAAFYGYYHVVRQHYGFLALYRARSGERDVAGLRLERWCLYAGCFAPYVAFLLAHPRARVLLGLTAGPASRPWERAAVAAAVAVWIGALAIFLVVRAGRAGGLARPKESYIALTILFYGLAYFAVGRLEPVYRDTRGPDEDFLLLSVMVTLFHDVQYVALVWLHNRNRYDPVAGDGEQHGAAAWVSASPARFLGGCLAFSGVVYLASACAAGVFPGCTLGSGRIGPVTVSQLGLCFWWGLALHHYYLDQKIWRVRTDSALRRSLGLA